MMVLIQSVSQEGPKRDQPVHEIKNTRYEYGYSHTRLFTQTSAKKSRGSSTLPWTRIRSRDEVHWTHETIELIFECEPW